MKQTGNFSGITIGRVALLFLVMIFCISGCRAISDFRRAYDSAAIEWRNPDDGFGRKVVILASPSVHVPDGFMPGSNLSEMLLNHFTQTLSATCPEMIVDVPAKEDEGNGDAETAFSRCSRFGRMGANAVVSCDIDSIEAVPRHRGFWRTVNPFNWIGRKAREEKYPSAFKVRIRFTALSTFTAAQVYGKCLEKTFDPAYAADDENAAPGTVPGFLPVLSKLCDKGADAICDAVFNQVWTACVIDAGPDGPVISAGSGVGLSVGTVLDVWGKGEVIQSRTGNRFLLPGEKIGSVKVIRVNPDTAVVTPVSGKPPVAGSVVLQQGFSF